VRHSRGRLAGRLSKNRPRGRRRGSPALRPRSRWHALGGVGQHSRINNVARFTIIYGYSPSLIRSRSQGTLVFENSRSPVAKIVSPLAECERSQRLSPAAPPRLRLAVRSSLGCANSANCCVVGERLNSTLLPPSWSRRRMGSGGPGNGHSRQSTGHADDRLTSVRRAAPLRPSDRRCRSPR
jgi:hypothetical protein